MNNAFEYEKGNRKNLIKITGTDKIPIYGVNSYSNLIDGNSGQDFYFNNAIDISNQYIDFDLGNYFCMTKLIWKQANASSHGDWKLQGSKDGQVFNDIADIKQLGTKKEYYFSNKKSYKVYRLQGVTGQTSSSPWIYEIEFEFANISKKYLIEQQNKYYSYAPTTYNIRTKVFNELKDIDFSIYGLNNLSDLAKEFKNINKHFYNLNLDNGINFKIDLSTNIDDVKLQYLDQLERYEKGDRKNLIKVKGSKEMPYYGKDSYSNLIDGTNDQNFYFNNAIDIFDQYIEFHFPESICIDGFKWLQNIDVCHGKWQLQGKNESDKKFTNISEIMLGSQPEFKFDNDNFYSVYRLQGIEGVTSSSPWIYEIEFNIKKPKLLGLIQSNNDYYTIENSKLIKIDNINSFKNGFTLDKFNLKLLKDVDLNNTSIVINSDVKKQPYFEAMYSLKKPIIPINFIDKTKPFHILKQTNVDDNSNEIIINIKGENEQMVVDANDIVTTYINKISKIDFDKTLLNDGNVLCAFSIDKGKKWLSTNDYGATWNDLNINIPLKSHDKLTEKQKTNWNNALSSIKTNGVKIDDIPKINFNTLNSNTIRFAYVLTKANEKSVALINQMFWLINEKEKMLLGKDSDFDIQINDDSIYIYPKDNFSKVKVNIATEIKNNDSSGELGDCDLEIETLPTF